MTDLARGYRRLLACYPGWYRRVHEDEMLAVLMADAPPGRRRPGIAEAADLFLGALRIRCQPSRPAGAEPAWRDALAVVSVIVPLMVLLSLLASLASLLQVVLTVLPPGETRGPVEWNIPGLVAPLLLAALVPLALRMPRLATAGAAGLMIAGTLAALQPVPTPAGPRSQTADLVMTGAYGLLTVGMEIVALAASPGPRRGLQILTWKHWTFAVVAALAVTPGTPMTPPVRLAVIALICAAMALASPVGRWLLLLLAIPAYPTAARLLMNVAYLKLSAAGIAALYAPSLVLAVLAIAARARHSFRPS